VLERRVVRAAVQLLCADDGGGDDDERVDRCDVEV
jgi:hypothetical protein